MSMHMFVIYFLFAWIGCGTYGSMSTLKMERNCGAVYGADAWGATRSVLVNYTYNTDDIFYITSGNEVNCTIKFTPVFGSKIAVHFTRLHLYACTMGWASGLSVMEQNYDGLLPGYNRKLRGIPPNLCEVPLNKVYVTEWDRFVLNIRVFEGKWPDDGFSLIFNFFSDGPCGRSSTKHACDNGRCIDKSLMCNGHNPCGDFSDCPKIWTTGEIAGIVIGVACGVGVLGIAFTVIRYQLKLKKIKYKYESEADDNADDKLNLGVSDSQSPLRQIPNNAASPGVNDTQARSSVKTPINVEPTADQSNSEHRPPPPSYDVVVNHQELYNHYNVSDVANGDNADTSVA